MGVKTWYLVKGVLDEVEVVDGYIETAWALAKTLKAKAFIRHAQIPGTQVFVWDVYLDMANMGRGKIKPAKTFSTETIDAAHMWALAMEDR